jgi:eukaryotic-like serine/threonine-protein kinase
MAIMSLERLQPASPSGDLPELPVAGDLVQGRYRVEQELGRGGMGVVLAAQDEMLGRAVALKVVLPRMLRSEEAVERFRNEARSLARIDSRNVVRVLDFGTISEPSSCAGLPFMVLELLHGEDLFSVASSVTGGLSPSRVVRYALEACAGLAAAHAQGIIHRDLKPENLFLAQELDGTSCLKVLDFGIARSHSRRALTRGQGGVGSPGYMSPEQVEGHGRVDERADIWALGVVMYELLAQRPAFFGETAQSLCLQILNADVTPLSEIRKDLPTALVYVIERCMEREPDRRFANVAELADALAPLDNWNPSTDAELIRRRLEGGEEPIPSSGPRPVAPQHLASSDIVQLPERRARPHVRRVVAAIFVAVTLVPLILLLPRVAQAPELAPARAWSAEALAATQATWHKVRDRARELWMKEPAGEPAR